MAVRTVFKIEYETLISKGALDRAGFAAVLAQYFALHERYVQASEGDEAFAYTEQTNTSMLCAAASIRGMSAMNEFQHTKRLRSDKRSNRDGRADLYFLVENNGTHKEFYSEAKLKRKTVTQKTRLAALLENAGSAARADLDDTIHCRKKTNDRGIAITFFNFLRLNDDNRSVKEVQKQIREALCETERYALVGFGTPSEPLESWWDDSALVGHAVMMEYQKRA